nr:7-deoxyloganetic acid glucosyltransferase-like [Ipomoea trifida]
MDAPILSVKGMEELLRRRDLPGNCRVDDLEDPFFKFTMEFLKCFRTKHHIINSFQELEGSTLDRMRTGDMSNVYAIGPLHELLRNKLGTCMTTSSNGLHEDDKKCMDWLDGHPPNSVLYVCFGTLTLVSEETLVEFWHGLTNSGQRFLWALNPGLVMNGKRERGEVPAEILNNGLEGRHIIEEMVRDLMEVRKDEFLQRAKQFANSAKECAKEGGSSISSLENLIEDIKRM